MYCCTDFEIIVKDGGFIKQEDGTWVTVGHFFCKFCPYCGKNLRFLIRRDSNPGLSYHVVDSARNRTVALFEDREAAEQHIERL